MSVKVRTQRRKVLLTLLGCSTHIRVLFRILPCRQWVKMRRMKMRRNMKTPLWLELIAALF